MYAHIPLNNVASMLKTLVQALTRSTLIDLFLMIEKGQLDRLHLFWIISDKALILFFESFVPLMYNENTSTNVPQLKLVFTKNLHVQSIEHANT